MDENIKRLIVAEYKASQAGTNAEKAATLAYYMLVEEEVPVKQIVGCLRLRASEAYEERYAKRLVELADMIQEAW